ncbi:MAG TPA: hypothetical protein VD704_14030 [Gaiellaceae bacterium]|nr:hypothetical protein [Gaiellaceae bacterium]
MGVFLHCQLCGRKQADGLLSRNYWGHVRHAAGQELSACPTCKETHVDWEHRVLASLNGHALGEGSPGAADAGLGRTSL